MIKVVHVYIEIVNCLSDIFGLVENTVRFDIFDFNFSETPRSGITQNIFESLLHPTHKTRVKLLATVPPPFFN